MGVQNAAPAPWPIPDLTTTVLTLTIIGMASDSKAAGGHGGKSCRRTLSTPAMFAGAFSAPWPSCTAVRRFPAVRQPGSRSPAVAARGRLSCRRGRRGWPTPCRRHTS
nr:hypothetical protein [Streptomyces jeddahensis]